MKSKFVIGIGAVAIVAIVASGRDAAQANASEEASVGSPLFSYASHAAATAQNRTTVDVTVQGFGHLHTSACSQCACGMVECRLRDPAAVDRPPAPRANQNSPWSPVIFSVTTFCTALEGCSTSPDCTTGSGCSFGSYCTEGLQCTDGPHCSESPQCSMSPSCTTSPGCTTQPTCTVSVECTGTTKPECQNETSRPHCTTDELCHEPTSTPQCTATIDCGNRDRGEGTVPWHQRASAWSADNAAGSSRSPLVALALALGLSGLVAVGAAFPRVRRRVEGSARDALI
jgi:hypothetical protein